MTEVICWAVTMSPTFTCARLRTIGPAVMVAVLPCALAKVTWRVAWSMAVTVARILVVSVSPIPLRSWPCAQAGVAIAGSTEGDARISSPGTASASSRRVLVFIVSTPDFVDAIRRRLFSRTRGRGEGAPAAASPGHGPDDAHETMPLMTQRRHPLPCDITPLRTAFDRACLVRHAHYSCGAARMSSGMRRETHSPSARSPQSSPSCMTILPRSSVSPARPGPPSLPTGCSRPRADPPGADHPLASGRARRYRRPSRRRARPCADTGP